MDYSYSPDRVTSEPRHFPKTTPSGTRQTRHFEPLISRISAADYVQLREKGAVGDVMSMKTTAL
jgi:hypothetical protein